MGKATLPEITPIPRTEPSRDLAARDFALYVDGRRIAAEKIVEVKGDGISVSVVFETSLGALDSDAVDPREEAAWGGWRVGDDAHLRQPTPNGEKFPTNGYVSIIDIEMPKRAGDPVYFVCKAIQPVYDFVADEPICDGGDFCKIPSTWFQR